MRPLVKICGLTKERDVEALDGVVEYLGFIVEPTSPRAVAPPGLARLRALVSKSVPVLVAASLPPRVAVDMAAEAEIPVVQHHGGLAPGDYDYAPSRGVRLAPVATYRPGLELRPEVERLLKSPHEYVLVDADKKSAERHEGGLKIPLGQLRAVAHLGKVAVAGGVTPDNAQLVAQLGPFMVDVASGVEKRAGEKDLELVRRLLKALGR